MGPEGILETTEASNPLNTQFPRAAAQFRPAPCTGSPVFVLRTCAGSIPAKDLSGKITFCAEGVLALAAAYAIWDVDGTIIANTPRYLHDGEGGRFNRAMRLTLRKALKSVSLSSDRTSDQQKKSQILVNVLNNWEKEYGGAFAGNPELQVCEKMCQLAEAKLAAAAVLVRLDAKYMKKMSHKLVRKVFEAHREEMHLISGARELAAELKKSGASMALCTSSPKGVIRYILSKQFPDWKRYFCKGHYDAVKKSGQDGFSASAVENACGERGLKCDPGLAVMIGDSSADMGTAIMAGVPLVIIRLPANDSAAREKLENDYRTIAENHKDKANRCSVVVISDYPQVSVEPWHELQEESRKNPAKAAAASAAAISAAGGSAMNA